MMTVDKIKKNKKYDFGCEITNGYKNETDIDEWGSANMVFGKIGVEYNFCIDNSTNAMINCSAIYPMEADEEDYWETEYNTYIHYEINFDDEEWKDKLENAMCEALIKFFDL